MEWFLNWTKMLRRDGLFFGSAEITGDVEWFWKKMLFWSKLYGWFRWFTTLSERVPNNSDLWSVRKGFVNVWTLWWMKQVCVELIWIKRSIEKQESVSSCYDLLWRRMLLPSRPCNQRESRLSLRREPPRFLEDQLSSFSSLHTFYNFKDSKGRY